ncbi:MAG: hypothetical protein WCV91_02470 [Candidatus Margulisiibacteriota bacterium]
MERKKIFGVLGFGFFLPILIIVGSFAFSGCGSVTDNSTTTTSSTTTTIATLFSHYVADLSKIKYINQPGNSDQIAIKDRCHIAIKNTETTIEVYAPATAEVLGIAYYIVRADNVPEYALYFKVSGTCYYFFAHLIDISSKLKAVGPSVPQPTSAWVAPTSPASVSAGELIGYTEGTPQAHTYDFGAYDPSHKNSVANESRYSADDRYITGVNPYLYYPESMRTDYLVLSANPAGTVVATTECRGVCRDVLGTASGYWYLTSGTDATYQEKMHIISEPNESVYWGGVGGGGYEYKTLARTPLDPEKLTIGMEYGYSGPYGYLYLSLLSSTEMGVYFSTTDPGSFPSSGYKTYQR